LTPERARPILGGVPREEDEHVSAAADLRRRAGVEKRRLPRLIPNRELRQQLETLGIRRSWTANLPLWTLSALLLVAAVVPLVAWLTGAFSAEIAATAVTVFVALAGLLVALVEWRAGLAEKALDALYARFELANRMRVEAAKGIDSGDEAEINKRHPDAYGFYVFTEIDSLEYAVVRYRHGLGMSDLVAHRAIRHFERRCEMSPTFRGRVATCADIGGYLDETPALVKAIAAAVTT
jgi:hypothetical protein